MRKCFFGLVVFVIVLNAQTGNGKSEVSRVVVADADFENIAGSSNVSISNLEADIEDRVFNEYVRAIDQAMKIAEPSAIRTAIEPIPLREVIATVAWKFSANKSTIANASTKFSILAGNTFAGFWLDIQKIRLARDLRIDSILDDYSADTLTRSSMSSEDWIRLSDRIRSRAEQRYRDSIIARGDSPTLAAIYIDWKLNR